MECSLLVKDILSNPVHKDFYHYWKSILTGSDKNLHRITKKLIKELSDGGFLPSESERVKRHDDGGRDKTCIAVSPLFGRAPVQRLPAGFVPQRHVVVKQRAMKGKRGRNAQKSLYVEDEVLIAEIGGGPRWKQVNFPVDIFENFFGARRGDNSYQIELRNIAKDGSLGEEEKRQAVSVKSQNYRFEINCAETEGDYPGNERRPIGLFIKLGGNVFLYRVLLHGDKRYEEIREYLYNESRSRPRELKRAIVHVEAIHVLYPELVV